VMPKKDILPLFPRNGPNPNFNGLASNSPSLSGPVCKKSLF